MKQLSSPLPPLRENGSTLLVALIILAAISFVGSMALTGAHYELQLSRNDKVITRLKTHTTAVALAAAQKLETLNEDTLDDIIWQSQTRLPWLSRGPNDLLLDPLLNKDEKHQTAIGVLLNPTTWSTANSIGIKAETYTSTPLAQSQAFNDDFQGCEFQAIDVGPMSGNSMAVGNNSTTTHSYYVAGYCVDGPQFRIVQLGYHKKH